MIKEKRSFFERLTGAIRVADYEETLDPEFAEENSGSSVGVARKMTRSTNDDDADPGDEGELVVDVYQTHGDIVIKTMVPGVRPEDLDINITRDMVTIKGKRETERTVADNDYFHKELYWGSFSRTILLPQEIEIEDAEAIEKHGLLIIRLPKLDKNRQTKIRVKNSNN